MRVGQKKIQERCGRMRDQWSWGCGKVHLAEGGESALVTGIPSAIPPGHYSLAGIGLL